MGAFYPDNVDKTVVRWAGKTLTGEKFAGISRSGNGGECHPGCPLPH
jgi:hypothetical protein